MVEVRIYNCLLSLDMGENLTRVGVSLLEPMYPLPHTGRRFPFYVDISGNRFSMAFKRVQFPGLVAYGCCCTNSAFPSCKCETFILNFGL